METTSTTARPELPSPDVIDVLWLSLKAIGVAGVFAVVGYIALIAHEEFLGIQLEVHSVTQLSFAAAAFWLNSILTVLQRAQVHWIITLAIVLLFVLLSWPHITGGRTLLDTTANKTRDRLHLASELGIVAVLGGVSASALLWYELPTTRLRDVIIIGLCAQPGVSSDTIIDRRANQLWSLVVDSRGRELRCPSQSADKAHQDQANAESRLKDGYAFTLIGAVAGWLLVCLRRGLSAGVWLAPFRMIGICGLIVTTLLIPYSYGKIISPTTMASVLVRLQDKVEQSAIPGSRSQSKGTPKMGERWLQGRNLLVTEDDKSVVVLSIDNQVSRLLEIPRSEITRLETMDIKDALSELIENQKPVTVPLKE